MTTEDETVWEPVDDGDDYNDFPLAFINVDSEDELFTLNVDGEEHELPPQEFQGTYKGCKDISSDDNPEPSIKHLVESEADERTYAVNKVKSLTSKLEEVEEGDVVKVAFEGIVEPEDDDGLPWQNWEVYTPQQ